MILQLHLRSWRAFDELDLELGPGTTFIVASNGIGKTSLMTAVAWGIFGEASGVDPMEERRGDAETTEVELDLRLPTIGTLSIHRWTDRRGRPQLQAKVADRLITTQADLERLLSDELGADLHILARLTFMTHGGSSQSEQGEFHLRDHLASVFGVAPLLKAARAAQQLVSESESAIRKLKAARRIDGRERETVLAEIAAIDERLESLRGRRDEAISRMNDLDERRRLAGEWDRYRSAVESREQQLAVLLQKGRSLVPEGTRAEEDPYEALSLAEQGLRHDLSAAEGDVAAARAQIVLTEEAMSQLRRADALCPTCLRPLGTDEAAAALGGHKDRLRQARAVASKAEQVLEARRSRLAGLSTILVEIRSLPEPVRPSAGDDAAVEDVEAARGGYEAARARVQELDQLVAEQVEARRRSVELVKELDHEERQMKELTALLRQEGVAQAAADTFGATADAITRTRIEPLVAEVGRRWKRVFGSDGLRLSSAGEITREIGGRVLPFRSLSGGEKVWASLLTRLLVTSASTRAPFVWLDEPLEHLDPRLRKLVAGMLARASQGGALRQVVVTTYESELARQLMEDVPSASLIYVRASD